MIASFHLDCLRDMPAKFRSQAGQNEPFISRVSVALGRKRPPSEAEKNLHPAVTWPNETESGSCDVQPLAVRREMSAASENRSFTASLRLSILRAGRAWKVSWR